MSTVVWTVERTETLVVALGTTTCDQGTGNSAGAVAFEQGVDEPAVLASWLMVAPWALDQLTTYLSGHSNINTSGESMQVRDWNKSAVSDCYF